MNTFGSLVVDLERHGAPCAHDEQRSRLHQIAYLLLRLRRILLFHFRRRRRLWQRHHSRRLWLRRRAARDST